MTVDQDRAVARTERGGALAAVSPTAAIDSFKILLPDWFVAQVDFNGPIPPHRPELGPCWVWTGPRSKDGYGWIGRRDVRDYAHRVASRAIAGEIPSGVKILHACDYRPCVRHLFRGTQFDNMQDMVGKGRNYHVTHPETLARGERHRSRTSPETLSRGESHGMSKLNDAKVSEIRRTFTEGGTSQSALARQYGVTVQAINDIVRGKTWKHVSPS